MVWAGCTWGCCCCLGCVIVVSIVVVDVVDVGVVLCDGLGMVSCRVCLLSCCVKL